jgi:hypothetical protein
MADASNFFAIRTITADISSWQPITAPIPCNTWSVRPEAAVKMRTDQTDATTEDTIAAGMQSVYLVAATTGIKFPSGTTFAYVQAVTGSVLVHVQFAR